MMTAQLSRQPDSAILSVKWRRGRHGGRHWAKPALCDAQIKGLVTEARSEKAGKQEEVASSVQITVTGALGKKPNDLRDKLLMNILGEAAQEWKEVDSQGQLRPKHYVAKAAGEAQWTGSLWLRWSTKEEASQCMIKYDGAAIMVNGVRTVIRAFNSVAAKRLGRRDV